MRYVYLSLLLALARIAFVTSVKTHSKKLATDLESLSSAVSEMSQLKERFSEEASKLAREAQVDRSLSLEETTAPLSSLVQRDTPYKRNVHEGSLTSDLHPLSTSHLSDSMLASRIGKLFSLAIAHLMGSPVKDVGISKTDLEAWNWAWWPFTDVSQTDDEYDEMQNGGSVKSAETDGSAKDDGSVSTGTGESEPALVSTNSVGRGQ